MYIFISLQLGEVEVSNLTILVLAFFSSFTFIIDLYSLYELMPTAMNGKEEKKTKTNIVRFDTSTSPSWKDIKMFIRENLS